MSRVFGAASVWQRSITGEMCWIGTDGPTGLPVTPLLLGDAPCVALPYMHLGIADDIARGEAVFTVTDRHHLAEQSTGMSLRGKAEIIHDLDGARFIPELLDQELVKFPPTRLRADGLMAQREHWWWVARILVVLHEVSDTRELPARTRADDAVLVRQLPEQTGRARVDVVTAQRWPSHPGERITLWRRDGGSLAESGSPGFTFSHRASPDFERWERWYRSGRLDGDDLVVTDAVGAPGDQFEPFGLRARWRNHRHIAAACRAGITAVENRGAAN
ncbi:MAG TPA: hypothetical protein VK053_23840 [Jiangellaceae bacterium]|nr:hypothetical protein [Jiangellaceae bacterium]